MSIDERIEALTMSLELIARDREADNRRIQALIALAEKDGENIHRLARIADIHERRITALEGGDDAA